MKKINRPVFIAVYCLVGWAVAGMPQPVLAQALSPLPCEEDARFQAFDFWVGRWDVFNGQQQLVGTNTIEKREQGCMLLEQWTGKGGGTGTSMNFYDIAKAKWVQYWMAANGNAIWLEGGLKEGAMHLVGEWVTLNGTVTPLRGTWTPLPDGRVRQFFEQSTDGGATWTTWFDGYYVRKEE